MTDLTHIETFVAKLQEEANADRFFADMEHVNAPEYTVDPKGKKFIRIVKDANNNGSVWGFIELETGNIYKAAGWKSPAKGVRGHIDTAEYGRNYTWQGPNYLR